MQTHMQTQAKSTLVCFHTTKMYAEACTHQNTHRRRHSNSPPGIICINRSSAGAVQPTCLCIFFFSFWVLNNSCLAPVDLSVCYCLSVAFSQPLSFLFLSQQLSSFALLHCLSFCLLQCLITTKTTKKKMFSLFLSSIHSSFFFLTTANSCFILSYSPFCVHFPFPPFSSNTHLVTDKMSQRFCIPAAPGQGQRGGVEEKVRGRGARAGICWHLTGTGSTKLSGIR